MDVDEHQAQSAVEAQVEHDVCNLHMGISVIDKNDEN